MYHLLTSDRRKLKRFREEWETGAFNAQIEDVYTVSSYWRNKRKHEDTSIGIDQLTWDDLAMQEVFEKLNYTQTSVGSEYLFDLLHDVDPALVDAADKEALYTLLLNDHVLREKVLLILSSLGKDDYANTSLYFYDFDDQKLKRPLMYVILFCLPFMSMFLMFASLQYGLISLFGSFMINLFVYYKNKRYLENDLRSMTYVASMIHTGKKLATIEQPIFTVYKNMMKGDGQGLRKISFWGKVLSIGGNRGGDFDFLFEYFRIVFLLDFIAYNRIVQAMITYRTSYKRLWESIGELDAAIAVAFYRKSLAQYTIPKFVDEEELLFEDIAHPLIDDPVTNSAKLGRNVLITGSNASGKSTYIKAIAINAILAQTIHTVLAKEWSMKRSNVVTSMSIQDNILEGDSYFIAEIKSLQRIVTLAEEGKPIISFIDEILKGTNTIERIAASAAIMEWLSIKQGMTLIASHDIELTEIAGELYSNYHFRETIENEEVLFDYKVHEGPSMTRNAVKLLGVLDYPERVTIKANQLAQNFMKERKWQKIGKHLG